MGLYGGGSGRYQPEGPRCRRHPSRRVQPAGRGPALIPLAAQRASADSAAIVALELEMSRLLMARRIDEYATHLTSDYARTTREGIVEGRDAALAG
jgi:hypothetical protein